MYRKGKKSDVPDENLFASTNKMSRKVMVSAAISWYGAMKPFFVNKNGVNPIQNGLYLGCSQIGVGGGGQKKAPLPKICHTFPAIVKLDSYTLPKEDPKNISIT